MILLLMPISSVVGLVPVLIETETVVGKEVFVVAFFFRVEGSGSGGGEVLFFSMKFEHREVVQVVDRFFF